MSVVTTSNGPSPPTGWTNEPTIISGDLPVDAASSDPNVNPVAQFFKDQNLSLPVTPVFAREPATGDEQFLFKSGDSHYLWNNMAFSLCKIVDPTGIDAITAAMRDKGGLVALKLQEVPA